MASQPNDSTPAKEQVPPPTPSPRFRLDSWPKKRGSGGDWGVTEAAGGGGRGRQRCRRRSHRRRHLSCRVSN